ncbi:MAG: hypothetical protein JTJ29_11350, partial [Bifidobacterium sp.]|nr:hypothetical protein [Bifidobacterium sp.]
MSSTMLSIADTAAPQTLAVSSRAAPLASSCFAQMAASSHVIGPSPNGAVKLCANWTAAVANIAVIAAISNTKSSLAPV